MKRQVTITGIVTCLPSELPELQQGRTPTKEGGPKRPRTSVRGCLYVAEALLLVKGQP
jgi:hypothetical protein